MIPYGRQSISEADIASVVAVLRSDFLTQGPAVPRFEQALADYCDVGHAVAVNSATSALHLACLALDVGPGDVVWTSPNTFVASANCAVYCGAEVDFVDIDSATFNLSIAALTEKLKWAEQRGMLPKVVIAVHFAGLSCDMQAIYRLSETYGFSIIEDASHAIGGQYLDQAIGCCRYSDITVFSFHPVKIITTGEGGVATTNNPELARRMTLLRSHGITRESSEMTHLPDGPWYYQQIELGFNYRMTDMQAALGLSQLGRLDDFVAKRHELVKLYYRYLSDLPVVWQRQTNECYSAFHLFVVRMQPKNLWSTQIQVFERMREADVGVNLHYIPVHLQPFYRAKGFAPGDFPVAEAYYEQAITLPLYPDLAEVQIQQVVDTLRKASKDR